MNFEHFKTCVRAFFPGHDFSWIRDCRMHFIARDAWWMDVTYVACRFVPIVFMDAPVDDEEHLVHYLKECKRFPCMDPRTLKFGGDAYLDSNHDLALSLNCIEISTHARIINPYDRYYL